MNTILKEEIAALLAENKSATVANLIDESKKPYIIMVVGVNGEDETTTIGKLAYQFKQSGKNVLLGAADNFHAAFALDQLNIWAERVQVPIVSQGMNADPASVAFDTVKSGVAQNSDVVLLIRQDACTN